MELDDLKNTWEALSSQMEKQQNLTSTKINEMTRTRYIASLKKVAYPEVAGACICFAGAAFTGLHFSTLDTPFLQGAGITAILLLLVLPVISLMSLRQFMVMGNVHNAYAETLRKFALQKIRFNKLQKVNIIISCLLLVTIIILLPKFFGGKDITGNKYFWTFSFSLGYIFLLFFSRWVSAKYNKALRQAEALLRETDI